MSLFLNKLHTYDLFPIRNTLEMLIWIYYFLDSYILFVLIIVNYYSICINVWTLIYSHVMQRNYHVWMNKVHVPSLLWTYVTYVHIDVL